MKPGHIIGAGVLLVGAGVALAWALDQREAEAGLPAADTNFIVKDGKDEGLMQARADARATFGDFWALVSANREGLDAVSIKVSIPHDAGVEHLWMTGCTRVEADVFDCVVSNEPVAVPLKIGTRHRFASDAISDWMYRKDGRIHGGYSIRALLPTLPTAQADSMRAMLAPLPG